MADFDLVKSNGVTLDATSLSLTRRMDLDEAEKFVTGLDSMESGLNWWVGDFLLAMEVVHGEAYAQIIPDTKVESWRNYMWVASRVKPNTRRPNLTWTHHQAVASLLHERQEIFLARAEEEKLSVTRLKELVSKEKGRKIPEHKLLPVTCPKCGTEFEVTK